MGTDLVHIPSFADLLAQPGTTLATMFSPRERRWARASHSRWEAHLAGRWAAKEAFIKAWAQARYGEPPALPDVALPGASIEVRPDRWGRVRLGVVGEVAEAVERTLGPIETELSISHDGEYAFAVCRLTWM